MNKPFVVCNYCKLKEIEKTHHKLGKIVVTVHGTEDIGYLGPGVNIHSVRYISEKLTNENFVAWMAEISNKCEC